MVPDNWLSNWFNLLKQLITDSIITRITSFLSLLIVPLMILSNPDVLSLYLHVALLTQHVVACDQNKSILTALSLGLSPLVDCVKSPLLSVDDE